VPNPASDFSAAEMQTAVIRRIDYKSLVRGGPGADADGSGQKKSVCSLLYHVAKQRLMAKNFSV
jgi:hypothetical protein